ncbi:MAG: bifunctional uridylyltransferase/uridylyl-removing enzyme [Phycisphaerae bacterium]
MSAPSEGIMTSPPPDGGSLRDRLHRGRAEIQARHAAGAGGTEVVTALTTLCDDILGRAWTNALDRVSVDDRPRVSGKLALVAVGGYGRGDMAPYSDVDLLFLHDARPSQALREFISALIRDLWDLGLALASSVRTPTECASLARTDLTIRTTLMEARLILGDAGVFARLQQAIRPVTTGMPINRLLDEIVSERAREHQDYYAQTVYLLEPNVKKSPGGLRDVHVLRWLAAARHGRAGLEVFRESGGMCARDAGMLAEATDFLHRVRNELHFHAGAAQDVLTREEQIRLAEWMGFTPEGPLLAVERFMRHYYRQTTALHNFVMHFVSSARSGSRLRGIVNRLMTDRVGDCFLLNREHIAIDPAAERSVLADADKLLQLFDLARSYGVSVAYETLERIRSAAEAFEVTPAARRKFFELLGRPAGLGRLLRDLHSVGLLSRLIPSFEHARGLIQFNLCHKYTVDEHSIRAVEAATERIEDHGPLGRAYREIRRRDILHLALLVHDLGKGLGEDHSEIGRELAMETAAQFGLTAHERDVLVFLVHRHLLMAHTAFRRDLADERTLIQFTRTVGTPEVLRLLFVMTAADTEAVAPESWTAWKSALLVELYYRAMAELTGEVPSIDEASRSETVRRQVCDQLCTQLPREWLEAQLEASPNAYLVATPATTLHSHLRSLRNPGPAGVTVEFTWLPDTGACEYTIFARDDLVPGIFSKIAGVLAAVGFQIGSAQIVTRSDGLVIDTFRGFDQDFAGRPPASRSDEIGHHIRQVLLGRQTVEALLRRRRMPPHRGGPSPRPAGTVVEIDNESSDRYTIIEVFADDRQGLLYTITRTLFELGLSVVSAKISTHLDQVVDAFYVTAGGHRKLTDADALESIRDRLLEAIQADSAPPSRR